MKGKNAKEIGTDMGEKNIWVEIKYFKYNLKEVTGEFDTWNVKVYWSMLALRIEYLNLLSLLNVAVY